MPVAVAAPPVARAIPPWREPILDSAPALGPEPAAGWPLLATPVPAGFPAPADDYIERRLSLDAHLIRNPESTFLARASGNSLAAAGIRDGDLLVVDRSREAKSGSIVVAVVDGELTVKRLRVGPRGQVRLEAENPAYRPILVRESAELVIWGVVAHAIRSY